MPAALLAALALAGCGNGPERPPSLSRLPLAPRTHVQTAVRVCDPGQNAFCALELVVVGRGYRSSRGLLDTEYATLHRDGWREAGAPIGQEHAADSPHRKLRVTYATAAGDLEAVDLGWIHRARRVTLALSRALFAHRSALSLTLELDTG